MISYHLLKNIIKRKGKNHAKSPQENHGSSIAKEGECEKIKTEEHHHKKLEIIVNQISNFFDMQALSLRNDDSKVTSFRYHTMDIKLHLYKNGIQEEHPLLNYFECNLFGLELYMMDYRDSDYLERIIPLLKDYYFSLYKIVTSQPTLALKPSPSILSEYRKINNKIFQSIPIIHENYRNEMREKWNNYKKHSEAEFHREIEKHTKVLFRKRKSLVLVDDYGFDDTSRWDKEKERFLSKFLLREFWTHHSIEEGSELIDKILDHNHDSLAVIFEGATFNDEMSPYEYEAFCSHILSCAGWVSNVTKGSGDQGVDVIAKNGNISVAIQCKKFSNPVGNFAVQEVFSGAEFYGLNHGIVVTNNTYTPSARSLAAKLGVTLIHHDQLHDLLNIINNKIS